MPITPLHFGPAMLLKRAVGRQFSLAAFLAAQVLLDLEPGLKLFGLVPISDGPHLSHTWPTGAVVGLVAAVVGVGAGLCGWRRSLGMRLHCQTPTVWIAAASAALGVMSHLLLDGIYHADVAASIGLPGLSGVVPPLALDAALLVALVLGLAVMTLSSKRQ